MALNQELSDLFKSFSRIMELKGENVFKVIAFQKVSRILEDPTLDVKAAIEGGSPIEGVGESSRRIIAEYIRTGRSTEFEEVSTSVPPGLLPMMDIPGLGPKTIHLFWKERNIVDVEGLVKAIDDGSLKGLKGVGDKKIQAIKEGIALRAQSSGRIGIVEALPIAEELVARLRELKQVKQAEYAGSLRRRKETIGDVDLICSGKQADDGAAIAEAFTQFPEVTKVLGQGTTKASVLTAGGLQVDLRIVPQEHFGAALLYFTGSKEHNVRIRGRALDMGLTLNEWGLYKLAEYDKAEKKTGEAPHVKPVASRTEADVYKKLGLAYVEPEMREDRGEVAAAEQGELPELIELKDILGDLHCHTLASDGEATIEQMAEAAIALGYEFLGITDHSKSQVIANGLSVDRLLAHAKAIRKVNDKYKEITLLAGCEVDILADGHMDYEDAVLAELDFVVASPHVALKQDEAKATDRLVRAIENRYTTLVGHPTGRLIDRRAGLPIKLDRVVAAAVATGTALEINAGYPRLDLNDVMARAAAEGGARISINTDAHSTGGLRGMPYGVHVARRAWLTRKHVINCLTTKELLKFIGRKRDR
ncbi:MAG TPA: DNA polymerase/3'-5' exonuclease PolX [Humisphaera sp.]